MKKLFLVATAILVAFTFAACTKDLTYEEMLTTKKGWVLTAATSEPPYIMESEEGEAPEHLRDLMNGYFYDWELDDIYFYDATYALRVDPGSKKPPAGKPGYDKVYTLGTWSLDYPKLTTKVPSFYDKNSDGTWVMDVVTVTDLTENTLQYKYTWNASKKKKNAKEDEIYTFTLTFRKK